MQIDKTLLYFDNNITEHIIEFMPLCITLPILTNTNFLKMITCAFYQIILQHGLTTFKLRTSIQLIDVNDKDVSMQTEYLIYKWLYDHTIFKTLNPWISTGKITQIYRGYILNNINNYYRAWMIYISHHKLQITQCQFNLKRKLCIEIETIIQTIIKWKSIKLLPHYIISSVSCNGCILSSCSNRFCVKSINCHMKYYEINPLICKVFERPGSLADHETCYKYYNIIRNVLVFLITTNKPENIIGDILDEYIQISRSFIPITKTILNWSCNTSKLERNSLGLIRSNKQYNSNNKVSWLDAMHIY